MKVSERSLQSPIFLGDWPPADTWLGCWLWHHFCLRTWQPEAGTLLGCSFVPRGSGLLCAHEERCIDSVKYHFKGHLTEQTLPTKSEDASYVQGCSRMSVATQTRGLPSPLTQHWCGCIWTTVSECGALRPAGAGRTGEGAEEICQGEVWGLCGEAGGPGLL